MKRANSNGQGYDEVPLDEDEEQGPDLELGEGNQDSDQDSEPELEVTVESKAPPTTTQVDLPAATYHGAASTPDALTKAKITYTKTILTIALMQELVFLIYQKDNTKEGLLDLGVTQSADGAETMAWPLAVGDLGANITATNPDDADAVALNKRPNLDSIKYFMVAVDVLSHVSYAIGATASGIPAIQLLANASPLTQQIFTPIIAAAFSIPGDQYYTLFNANNLDKTYQAMNGLLANPLKPLQRMYENPVHALRYFEALLRYVAVAGFRTTSFIFIAEVLTPLLLKPYNLSPESVALMTSIAMGIMGVTTFVNVSMTRFIRSFTKLIDPKFDTVSAEEYARALPETYTKIGAKLEAFISHAASAITAVGYALCASSLVADYEWEWNLNTLSAAILVGSVMFAKSAYVEHTAAVFAKAIENKKGPDAEIALADINLTTETLEAVRIKVATKYFTELTETYQSTPVELLIAIVDFIARMARMISFYAFLVTVSAALQAVSGMSFTQQQIFALCLILAPENFKNDFLVFQIGMRETITNYLAKNAIETYIKRDALTTSEKLKVYFKGPLDFDVQHEVIPTLIARKVAIEAAKPAGEQRLLSSGIPNSSMQHGERTFRVPSKGIEFTPQRTGFSHHTDPTVIYDVSTGAQRIRNFDPITA